MKLQKITSHTVMSSYPTANNKSSRIAEVTFFLSFFFVFLKEDYFSALLTFYKVRLNAEGTLRDTFLWQWNYQNQQQTVRLLLISGQPGKHVSHTLVPTK